MKNRVVKLTPNFLIEALLGKATKFASNLPTNSEILDIKHDLFSNQILAVIRSDSFQDLAENQPIPEFAVTYAPISKTQLQTSAAVEPQPAKQTQIQQSQKTSKIEEEFSPEQRRLLSFKTENEQVIIKPTQFLKAEWEDINETVRDLGGRWVKGDIISYWAIQLG
jgi:hypothetical protein